MATVSVALGTEDSGDAVPRTGAEYMNLHAVSDATRLGLLSNVNFEATKRMLLTTLLRAFARPGGLAELHAGRGMGGRWLGAAAHALARGF